MTSLRPLTLLWERFILSKALESLCPTHPAVPAIVRRLNDPERSPSPLHPHDSIVMWGCAAASLALLAFAAAGWVR